MQGCIAPIVGESAYWRNSSRAGEGRASDFIVELTRFVAVATTDTESVRYAAALPMTDFEDALQVAMCQR